MAIAETPPAKAARLWLLAALALVALPQLLRLPVGLASGGLLLILWRLLHELRGWRLPGRWLRLLITAACIAAVGTTYQTLLGRDAGVALLTIMLCLKLLELERPRDGVLVVFLAAFLLVTHFLYSQSALTAGYMTLAVLLLTATLVTMNQVVPDLKGALITAGQLLLQAVPMMLVLFVLFPRIPGPLWEMPRDAGAARTGISDTMRPGSVSALADSQAVAFRVRFHSPPPPADRLYWRGPVLWITDGHSWRGLPEHAQGRLLQGLEAIDGEVDYTVTLEPHGGRWLLALDLPASLPPGAEAAEDYQLLAEGEVSAPTRYRLSSFTEYRTGPLPPHHRALALALPRGTNPRTIELGARWREAGLTDGAIVERALALFRDGPFFYSRNPPMLGADATDDFLFRTREGFCEHYAAAFTLLMRSAGLPARVVTGYQGGEHNRLADYLLVRQSDAHAWSEVWLQERGWTRVDPTRVIPPDRVRAAPDRVRFQTTSPGAAGGWLHGGWRLLRDGVDAMQYTWELWVVGYGPERQGRLLAQVGMEGWGRAGLLALLFAALAVILGVTTWRLLRSGASRDPVASAYERFCRKLRRAGLAREPAEGPQDFARRVAQERPALAPQVRLITGLYIALRYGPHPRREWVGRLQRLVARFRAG